MIYTHTYTHEQEMYTWNKINLVSIVGSTAGRNVCDVDERSNKHHILAEHTRV